MLNIASYINTLLNLPKKEISEKTKNGGIKMTGKTATLERRVASTAITVCRGCNMGYNIQTGELLEGKLPQNMTIKLIEQGYCFPCRETIRRSYADYRAEALSRTV